MEQEPCSDLDLYSGVLVAVRPTWRSTIDILTRDPASFLHICAAARSEYYMRERVYDVDNRSPQSPNVRTISAQAADELLAR